VLKQAVTHKQKIKSKTKKKKNWRLLKYNDQEEITEEDPELRMFIKFRWGQIRSFISRGPVQDLYKNFYYNNNFRELIDTIVDTITNEQTNVLKLTLILNMF